MILFSGPSLTGSTVSLDGFDVRGPVRQGDVYLATLEHPAAIGIIDGYFEGVPSVWHKEILWALRQGIPVLGAASMGALRAAEMDAFGMIGVGEIYAAYRDGEIVDDDEVALLHGPEELGYPGLSIAMVNVRATCRAAVSDGVIGVEAAMKIIKLAKEQFYKMRTWASIFCGAGSEVPDALADWISAHEVDQKRLDAEALVDSMREGALPLPQDVPFEFTDLWVRTTEAWRRREEPRPETKTTGYRLLGDIRPL